MIMGEPVQEVASASVTLTRGGAPIACGEMLGADENNLGFAWDGIPKDAQYVLEAVASEGSGTWGISSGKCSGQRIDNNSSQAYTAPPDGSVFVRVEGLVFDGFRFVTNDHTLELRLANPDKLLVMVSFKPGSKFSNDLNKDPRVLAYYSSMSSGVGRAVVEVSTSKERDVYGS